MTISQTQKCLKTPDHFNYGVGISGAVFPNQAFRIGPHTYGFQFHPEVHEEILELWLADSEYYFSRPGADDAQTQRDDHRIHADALRDWYHGFLQNLFGSP